MIALSVDSTYDDASRFRHSTSDGAYLDLTPKPSEWQAVDGVLTIQ